MLINAYPVNKLFSYSAHRVGVKCDRFNADCVKRGLDRRSFLVFNLIGPA